MALEDYKDSCNSFKSKKEPQKEEKHIEKVATGRIQKKSGFSKAVDGFLSEDRKNVKNYILKDVLIPWSKDLISNIVSSGLSMILYGDANHISKPGYRNGSTATKINYNGYFSQSAISKQQKRISDSYDFDNLVFDDRGSAEIVLTSMEAVIEQYGLVSIAEFYEFSDVTGKYTDNKYGWKNLKDAEILKVQNGYLIKFPKPELIDP